jgi:GntR family transcriptional regulator
MSAESLKLHEQVAARLWDDLQAAAARPGDRLPSERTLAEQYGVSRVTVRTALQTLAEQGGVKADASRGWFVGGEEPQALHVQGFADYARLNGLETSARVLESTVRPSSVAEAETLRIAPGAEVFELRRLRSLEGLVVVLEHNRLPLAACPALVEADFRDASLYATLLAADPPQVPRTADYSVEARTPTDEEQQLLEIDAATPALVATQLTFNQHQRPLELTIQVYRSDRYQFRASIANP